MNPLLLDMLARERLADRARQLEHHTRLQAAWAARAQAHAQATAAENVLTAAVSSRLKMHQ